jgi:hypothetical protein
MTKLTKYAVLRRMLLIIFSLYVVRSLVFEYGFLRGLQSAFLSWSFFVLCMPVARGRIVLGPFKKRLERMMRVYSPELVCWIFAIVGNVLSMLLTPMAYYRVSITHLLRTIFLTRELWTSILVCATSTFCLALFRSERSLRQAFMKTVFISTSILTTLILNYNYLVIIINSHGTP